MKNDVLERANRCLMPNYGMLGLAITSGEGAYVWTRDADGNNRKCLDLLCGLGVNSLGHCHPAVVKAIKRQAEKLMHVSNLYASAPMVELAEELISVTGFGFAGGRVFFCNSGTEANETAGKLARIRASEKFGLGKNKILSLRNSFHGRTFLSISLTGQSKMQDKFAPVVPGIEFVEMNDLEGLRKAVSDDVCAIIFETIQAEGGVRLMDKQFYAEIVRLSRKYNFLKIADEVQTGIGRTGRMFSYEHLSDDGGDYPDIITVAKALGGGLPIGAVIAKYPFGNFLLAGSHAATFGGNPVVCAGANAVLETIQKEKLCQKVVLLGGKFLKDLKNVAAKHPLKIKDVRGRGFMIGVELQSNYPASVVVDLMRKKGVLIGTAGTQVVRFLPPFIIEPEELNYALKQFEEVIKKI
jgi:predicted acetylornithine/succinylornithine family transaminase